eukprot:TRINITY_DN2076_c0_g1_i1.p1 TRINITY_DN2076_c0_g1~~TRINITY_DN2076_c0_g1_i1.p1  ORF type:complete len:855 (-),score=180.18 TRINITY_DN2076_c0_g1_i1:1931-4495(-)
MGNGLDAAQTWSEAAKYPGDLTVHMHIQRGLFAIKESNKYDIAPCFSNAAAPKSKAADGSPAMDIKIASSDLGLSRKVGENDAAAPATSTQAAPATEQNGDGSIATSASEDFDEDKITLADVEAKELEDFRARVLLNCMRADVEHRKKLVETVKVDLPKEELLLHNSGDEEVDKMLALGYYHVNAGNYLPAIEIFNEILQRKKSTLGALMGRGTCHIIQQDIMNGIQDFSQAIAINPKLADAYTRRAQAYLIIGRDTDAIRDFSVALNLTPPSGHSTVWNRRGLVYHKMHNFKLALEDFVKVIEKEPDNVATICLAGQCYMQMGDAHEAIRMFQRALAKVPHMVEALLQMGIAYRELGLAKPAIEWLSKSIDHDSSLMAGFYMRGIVHHGIGRLDRAAQDFSAVVTIQSDSTEGYHMRAVCYHGMGLFARAIQDYNQVISREPGHVAYYQREFCLYMHQHLDIPFTGFDIEKDVDPHIKEYWSKKSDATKLPNYMSGSRGIIQGIDDVNPERFDEITSHVVKSADELGRKIQLNTPGFFPNARQFRAAGLAMLHTAQFLSQFWLKAKRDKKVKITFREAFECPARWRRYSEPNDSVWWVDMLTPENFNLGWGPQTPMMNGQLKVIRYYPYYPKAFKLLVELTMQQSATDETRQIVRRVRDVKQLRGLVQRDFWVTSECSSIVHPKKKMEATLLTVIDQKPDGIEFYIRTPGARGRWDVYEDELNGLFKLLQDAVTKPTMNKDRVIELVVYIVYFWFNFQPLTRGSAVVGYIMLHSLFLSLDLEITEPIPDNVQYDWEAILSPNPKDYLEIIKPWISRSLKPSNTLKQIPCNISSTFNTIRKILAVLHPNSFYTD